MPRLSETEKAARRRRVLDGARRCFGRHGYEGATVVRLEEEIGLSRGAIFNWFPSKQELFLALAAEDNARLHDLFAERGIEGLLEAVTRDDPDWLAVYLEFGRLLRADPALRERWQANASADARERTKAWIVAGQADGRLRSDLAPDEIERFVGVIVDGIVVARALGFDAPRTELLLELTWAAVSPAAGRGPTPAAAKASRAAKVSD